jgi:hypothetical protein
VTSTPQTAVGFVVNSMYAPPPGVGSSSPAHVAEKTPRAVRTRTTFVSRSYDSNSTRIETTIRHGRRVLREEEKRSTIDLQSALRRASRRCASPSR